MLDDLIRPLALSLGPLILVNFIYFVVKMARWNRSYNDE